MSNSEHNFYFKEIDDEGLETLKVLSKADNFNKWSFDSIKNHCTGNILEIGSGIGNISYQFAINGHSITLSDLRENYRSALKRSFESFPNVKDVIELDLVATDFDSVYKDQLEKYDTVFALNVVEHIEDDTTVFKNLNYLLKPGGKLIILVPAFNTLYNRFDKELMHFRRYTANKLSKKFTDSNFSIDRSFYFNAAGIPAWLISGKLQHNKTIPYDQMSFFNFMVPLFKWIDKILFQKIGLSVVVVGTKK